jgi:anti-anti-sigma factor
MNKTSITVSVESGQPHRIIDIMASTRLRKTLMAPPGLPWQHARIILNFSGLEYMNSSGIGLLVTLLIRVNRQKQKLLAYGLSEHYRQIFELTRLNEAIGIYATEAEALSAART